MVSFTSPVIEAVVAGALATRRFVVYEPFLTVGGIHRMKKSEVQDKLRSRGMPSYGTVALLKKELKQRVLMEKRGQAERPTVNAFAWRRDEIRSFLREAGCIAPSKMRREDMLELLIVTVEEAKLKRERRLQQEVVGINNFHRNKRSVGDVVKEEDGDKEGGRPAKRVRTGQKSYSAVDVVTIMTKPVVVPVKTIYSGGKSAAKTATKVIRRTKMTIQDSVRGYNRYRQEGGRRVHKAKVDTEAKRLQKLHKNYGKATILGFSSFCGIGFGPKGISEAQARRMAKETENARLCRPLTDPIIKGYFGRLDDVERRLKEAHFNARNINNKTTPTIDNPFSRPNRRRARALVKFSSKTKGSSFGIPDRTFIPGKGVLKKA